MHFTRDPIIETIITPKEGCKLLVRNTKDSTKEEYFVDALEVLSFGHSFFYRSLERPKAFLVPISDYEIVEVKETRLALKSAAFERTKGSSRTTPPMVKPTPIPSEEAVEEGEEGGAPLAAEVAPSEERREKKRERRRHRRRREERKEEAPREEGAPTEEPKPILPHVSRLIPPPPTLISDTISRYKEMQQHKDDPEKEEEATPPEPEEPFVIPGCDEPEEEKDE